MVCRIKRGFAQTRALAEQVEAATMMLDSEALLEPLCDPVSRRTRTTSPEWQLFRLSLRFSARQDTHGAIGQHLIGPTGQCNALSFKIGSGPILLKNSAVGFYVQYSVASSCDGRFDDGDILFDGATAYTDSGDDLTFAGKRHPATHRTKSPRRDHAERIERLRVTY